MTEINPKFLYSVDELSDLFGVKNIYGFLRRYNIKPLSKGGKYLGAHILEKLAPFILQLEKPEVIKSDYQSEKMLMDIKRIAAKTNRSVNPNRLEV